MSDYRVQFEVFEGPLDLLLHLVKKQEVDIYQVNLTRIATEFVAYLEQMQELDLEVAGEFLVMAATLLYLKSRELLPVDQQAQPDGDDTDEDDPRWELIRRLVEYKKFKDAAAKLQTREAEVGQMYERRPLRPEWEEAPVIRRGEVSIFELVGAVSEILKRFHSQPHLHELEADPYSVSEKIESLRQLVGERRRVRFSELFVAARSRTEVVCIFLALLELSRMRQLELAQTDEFGEIDVNWVPPEVLTPPPPPPPTDAYGHPAAAPIVEAADAPQIV
ncbi:MAG TPA: segregation/condensation protein A [Verrucomicrobiota bacterium]|nr:chromosome segregation protein ScpA [Verrucomicrobiales bacterium]HRI15577.1 segregation/condensation protein A [Verrucomicrobiota bacterium]